MTSRNIYIREIGDFVRTYHLGEFVRGDKWKEQNVFTNRDELVNYLRSDDEYAVALRKRGKRTKMLVDIDDKDLANEVVAELKKIGFSARIMSKQIKK